VLHWRYDTEMAPQTRCTLRREMASIMKGLVWLLGAYTFIMLYFFPHSGYIWLRFKFYLKEQIYTKITYID